MARAEQKKTASKGRRVGGGDTLPFGKKNLVLFAAGFAIILVGYYLLSRNSITLAPVLLVFGYCVLIPYAIIAK